jgi:hypothetical protein
VTSRNEITQTLRGIGINLVVERGHRSNSNVSPEVPFLGRASTRRIAIWIC